MRFHDFIINIDDKDLSTILGVIETKNFELIMQQLDNFAALIDAFGGDPRLKAKVNSASAKLKQSLLDGVRALHPEHVFTVPEEESATCSRFLRLSWIPGARFSQQTTIPVVLDSYAQ